MTSYHRETARQAVARVIARVGLEDPRRLRQALGEAYPFQLGDRRGRRVWNEEIRKQTAKPAEDKPASLF
ncbi:MAG: hypothetical protein ACOCTI_05260 [Phycisphaeraceae bacterium]